MFVVHWGIVLWIETVEFCTISNSAIYLTDLKVNFVDVNYLMKYTLSSKGGSP